MAKKKAQRAAPKAKKKAAKSASRKGPAKKVATRRPQVERRKYLRRPIVDAFQVFAVLPSQGDHRIRLHDISERSVSFDLEALLSPVKVGEKLTLDLHFNTRLSVPLRFRVARVDASTPGLTRVGCELQDSKSAEARAYVQFVTLLDALSQTGRFRM